MQRKSLLTASAIALGLAIGTPAMADGHGGTTTFAPDFHPTTTTTTTSVFSPTSTYSPTSTFSPSFSSTKGDETKIVAEQELRASITNFGENKLVENEAGGYNSGDNSVNDNAFAAFAGILNVAWNTGVNANTQAGSNIAAQGNVHFEGP